MIASLHGKIAKEIWEANRSAELPRELWLRAKALMTIMHSTSLMGDLLVLGQPPKIRLHKLAGNRREYWSITIKLPWCITFKFSNGEFSEVAIENYHRG